MRGRGLEKVGVGQLSMKKVKPGGNEPRPASGCEQIHGPNQIGKIPRTKVPEVSGN